MSISGIHGVASSGFTSPYRKRDDSAAEGAYSNPNTGPDTVFFSEDALKMAQSRTTDSAGSNEDRASSKDKLQSGEARNADTRGSSPMELAKKSFFSMLLDSLFFAELEESAADGNNATNGEQPSTAKASKPLEDGEKVAEIKKTLADLAKGKADVSDVLKAVGGGNGGGTGRTENAATQSERHSVASSATTGKE